MVYVITDGGDWAKIGVANNVEARLRNLQTGNPRALFVIITIYTGSKSRDFLLEQALHERYKQHRISVGGVPSEWFLLNGIKELVDATKDEANGIVHSCGLKFTVDLSRKTNPKDRPIIFLADNGYLDYRTVMRLRSQEICGIRELCERMEKHSDCVGFGIFGIGERSEKQIREAIDAYFKDHKQSA